MIRCIACGTQNAPDEQSCRHCGAALGDHTTELGEDTATRAIPADDKTAEQLRRCLAPQIHLLRRLAGGGMSVVYLGRDTELRRLVAIKVLSDELSKDGVARARFTREAEAAAALVDPHVIKIYQVGTIPRTRRPYIIMQFVDGMTLQQEILTGKLPPIGLAKAVIGEVASALAAAHARGVVHRDIKPGNIVIDRETSRAVVLDFGIAAVVDGRHADREKLTRQGTSVGTPAYMSPEQAAAKEVTGQSDIYSLGVVAFEFVTGQLPLKADVAEGYLAAHLQDTPPDVRSLRPDLDKQLATLINRCLAKNPDERPSADEIARAYVPSARPQVEWPPPGLEALRGMGWKQLRTLLFTAAVGLAFFLLLFFAPGSDALRTITAPGRGLPIENPEGQSTEIVWLFLLAATIIATAPLALLGRWHGWKLTALLKWARDGGYPWPVLLDVALDGPDTPALINGWGVFALVSQAARRRMLILKRFSAGAMLLAVFLAVVGPTLWAFGVGNAESSDPASLITAPELLLVFLPAISAMVAAALLAVPEWLVRNRTRRWGPFGPLGWRLPRLRPELVREWLTGVDRAPSPGRGPLSRWTTVLAPVFIGGLLSTVILVILTIAITVAVTASQWSTPSRVIAEGILADTSAFYPWQRAADVVEVSALLRRATAAPFQGQEGLIDESTASLRTALPNAPTRAAILQRDSHAAFWEMLPGTLSPDTRQELAQDTLWPALASWRAMARAGSGIPFWSDGVEFGDAMDPHKDLRFPQFQEVMRLVRKNEAAAILALADGDRGSAEIRARETIRVGHTLLHDPLYGWLGPDVVSAGAGTIEEIGVVLGDRDLLLEARALDRAVGPAIAPVFNAVHFGGTLMAAPVDPPGLLVIGDRGRLPYVRWWAIAGIVPGFCGNAREILFGVDPRRGDVLERAASLADDLPHVTDWLRLNRRWLDAWDPEAEGYEIELPGSLVPLGWIGLDGLARRIAYCRTVATQLEAAVP